MQSQVHQCRNGVVAIRTDAGTYLDTLENFALDYGSAFPFWDGPGDGDEVLYEPGVRHPRISGGNVADAGPMPWSQGDAMIASVGKLIAAKSARETAAETTVRAASAAAEAARKAEIEATDAPIRARKNLFKGQADTADLAQRLKNATPVQIDSWIDGNVTNLAQARDVLKAIVKLLATQVN